MTPSRTYLLWPETTTAKAESNVEVVTQHLIDYSLKYELDCDTLVLLIVLTFQTYRKKTYFCTKFSFLALTVEKRHFPTKRPGEIRMETEDVRTLVDLHISNLIILLWNVFQLHAEKWQRKNIFSIYVTS